MKKPTILVIEDNNMIQQLLKFQLERLGWEVTISPTCELGLELLMLYEFDFIQTDGNLGEMDGVEFTAHATKLIPATGVLMFSGDPGKAEEFISAGGTKFFQKSDFSSWNKYMKALAVSLSSTDVA